MRHLQDMFYKLPAGRFLFDYFYGFILPDIYIAESIRDFDEQTSHSPITPLDSSVPWNLVGLRGYIMIFFPWARVSSTHHTQGVLSDLTGSISVRLDELSDRERSKLQPGMFLAQPFVGYAPETDDCYLMGYSTKRRVHTQQSEHPSLEHRAIAPT